MNVDIWVSRLCLLIVPGDDDVRRRSCYGVFQSHTTDQLLVRHVRLTIVANELIQRRELDVFEVVRHRRSLNVEVLYTA